MIEFLTAVLVLLASMLMFVAALGMIRLPDLPTRMHATTKSGVLAITLIMLAVAVYFTQADVTSRVLAIIFFTFLTAPVAAHAIGRAGYFSGMSLWHKTKKDELADYYKKQRDK